LKVLKVKSVLSVYALMVFKFRYLYESCCALEEHAPNRMDENFEETLRSSLRECRLNFKTFCFTHNIKAKVVYPSPVLTLTDEDGEDVWGCGPRSPPPAWVQTSGRYAGDRDGGAAEQEQEEGSLPEAVFGEKTKGGDSSTQLDTAQPCDS
jgi:hypothetical protein